MKVVVATNVAETSITIPDVGLSWMLEESKKSVRSPAAYGVAR